MLAASCKTQKPRKWLESYRPVVISTISYQNEWKQGLLAQNQFVCFKQERDRRYLGRCQQTASHLTTMNKWPLIKDVKFPVVRVQNRSIRSTLRRRIIIYTDSADKGLEK